MLFHNCPACDSDALVRVASSWPGSAPPAPPPTLPAPAVRAQGAKTLIDTHHHFYPPAYLKQQKEWEGARQIPPYPGVFDWTPAKIDRADGQERHADRGAVARLHARPVVRRRRRGRRQDRPRVPGFRGQDAPGLSGPVRHFRAAVDDEHRRDAEGDRIRLRHAQGRRHQPADQLRRQVARRSAVQAGAGGAQPPQGRGLCASAGRGLLRAAQRRHVPGGDRGAARHHPHGDEPAAERLVRALSATSNGCSRTPAAPSR